MVKTVPAGTSSAEFFERARARLGFEVPPGLSDPNIVPPSGDPGTDRMLQIIAREQPVRPAAVLIPVVDHPQPTVLLTQRSAHLNEHAGQISFPGGKIDVTDASPLDTALREAYEEVGLKREFIEPIGYLDLYGTGFGFRILPTVAKVRPGFDACDQPFGSRRCVRSAARLPDESREPSGAQQGIPRHGALLLRHAVRGALYLGRDRGHPAGALRADLSVMIRPALTEIGIFLIPFAVYAAFLIATRSGLLVQSSWPVQLVAKLALGSLLLVVVSFILLAHFSGASPNSTYVPAHIENGRLVPGVEK